LAAFRFDPKVNYQFTPTLTKAVSLYDLHTAGLDANSNYSRISYAIPFGFHLKSVIKRKYLLDFSVSWRYTFSDFIDDMGQPGVYRDKAYFDNLFGDEMLYGMKKADVALDIHNSNTPEVYYNPGSFRGGSNTDWYFITGVSFTYIKPYFKKSK